MMSNWKQIIGQVAAYSVFIAIVGYFSASPPYEHLSPGYAVIKLSFNHAGKPLGACRERSDEELAQLHPAMRERTVCPRERHPVNVRLQLNDTLLIEKTYSPPGLKKDGASSAYERFVVPVGSYQLFVQLGDNGPEKGYNYTLKSQVDLQPAQVLVIDFSNDRDNFVLK